MAQEANERPAFREYTPEEKRAWVAAKYQAALNNHTYPFTRKPTTKEIKECKKYISVALYHKTPSSMRFKDATTIYQGKLVLNMPGFCHCLQSHGVITYIKDRNWIEVILSQMSPIAFKQKITSFCRYGDYATEEVCNKAAEFRAEVDNKFELIKQGDNMKKEWDLVSIGKAIEAQEAKGNYYYDKENGDFGPDDMVEDTFGTMVPGATMVNVSSTEEIPAYQAANYGIPFVAPGKKEFLR